ncbi:MAG: hypothetical protein LW701_11970 [Fluviicola sp.]|jgi:hypothetical protein|nr:hypothetical protein [Fluviicola sp.]
MSVKLLTKVESQSVSELLETSSKTQINKNTKTTNLKYQLDRPMAKLIHQSDTKSDPQKKSNSGYSPSDEIKPVTLLPTWMQKTLKK